MFYNVTNKFMTPLRYDPKQYIISSPKLWNSLNEKLTEVDNELSIIDPTILVLAPGRNKIPRSIEKFGITALIPTGVSYFRQSLMALPGFHTQRSVSFEYRRPGGYPCVDGSFAVGLTYDSRVVALASGGLSSDGPIITQLQDVSLREVNGSGRANKYCNGLHDGIAWKPALLNAWCAVMQRTLPGIIRDMEGRSIHLQSAQNNRWLDRNVIINTHPGPISEEQIIGRQAERATTLPFVYDAVAMTLGATRDSVSRNFILPDSYNIPRPLAA